jgi:hypothetical protein
VIRLEPPAGQFMVKQDARAGEIVAVCQIGAIRGTIVARLPSAQSGRGRRAASACVTIVVLGLRREAKERHGNQDGQDFEGQA